MNTRWLSKQIPILGSIRSVAVCEISGELVSTKAVENFRKTLIEEGSDQTVFTHIKHAPLRPANSGERGFIADRDKYEIWKMSNLSINEWIDLVTQLGFPDPGWGARSVGRAYDHDCKDVGGMWNSIRTALEEIPNAERMSLAFCRKATIRLEVRNGPLLDRMQIARLLKINEDYFNINYRSDYAPGANLGTFEQFVNQIRARCVEVALTKQVITFGIG